MRSHSTVVSRWFVRPIPFTLARCHSDRPDHTPSKHSRTEDTSSFESCSNQLGEREVTCNSE